jgi:predicted amidohydrolase YtcJ
MAGMTPRLLAPLLLAAALLAGCIGPPVLSPELAPPADILFVNGPIHTADLVLGTQAALAVKGGRVAWVGGPRMATDWRGPLTQIVDLHGRAVVPGFTDAHIHLVGLANQLAQLDLVGTASWEEVVQRTVAATAGQPAGTWIVGRGWDQNDWEVKEFPVADSLSQATPLHPVLLWRIDGHALLANAAAMEAAGVDADTPVPEGGRILRDAQGRPTGVFVDAATDLITRAQPPIAREELARRVGEAIVHLHRRGITAIHDAGVHADDLALYEQLDRDGKLPLRVHAMVAADEPRLRLGRAVTGWPTADLTGNGHLAVRAVKLIADGALGSRGAALLEPYSDAPGDTGLLLADHERVQELAEACLEQGFQLAVHAIGDRANREVLDGMEAAFAAHPDEALDARFRIEHAQVLAEEDVPRFAALGVIPSMQPQHCTSDMPWAETRLGAERCTYAYAWRSLLDSGCIIPAGSDAPVEEVAPLTALHAAVTRQDVRGHPPDGWHPEQCMTRAEALASLTRWPAWAAFREDDLGTLAPGKRADLVVLSADLMTVRPESLPWLAVDMTLFDGEVVHRRGSNGP